MPEIAVIIPVHNGEETVADAVESVLEQEYDDFELFIMNHNSVDHTRQICESYAVRDSRIRIIDVDYGSGAGVPRNLGIQMSTAPYITFLDADDRMESSCLRNLYNGITRHSADVCIGGFRSFVQGLSSTYEEEYTLPKHCYSTADQVRHFFAEQYPDMILGVPWNKLYRRSVIVAHDIAFPEMRRLEDGIFNLRYFDKVQSAIVFPEILTVHMESAQVEKGKLNEDFFDEMRYFVIEYYRVMKAWHLNPKEYEQNMGNYYHNDVVSLLEKRILDDACTDREIDKIRNDRISRKMLSLPCLTGRYTRVAVYLLKARRYGMLRGIIRLKRVLKGYVPSVFYVLRKLVN